MAPSLIEALPAELLQPIFILSDFNIAFLDASPYIATKLSDSYIYRVLCRQYLSQETWHTHVHAERSRAQTWLFARKWMTWEFFKSYMTKTYEPCGCICGKTKAQGCVDPTWPIPFADATNLVLSRSHLPDTWMVKCRLPSKLLHGPWTTDKIQFLRFLLWTTSMTVDWADPEVRRLALQGKKEALLQGNLEVVELFNNNRRLGRAPTLETVRFAVIEAGCNRSVVYSTMEAARTWGLQGDSWNCKILDDWCLNMIAAGNPKGKWLRLKLQELRTSNHCNSATAGHMNPQTGDYTDVEGDELVTKPVTWVKKVTQEGWFWQSARGDIYRINGSSYYDYQGFSEKPVKACEGDGYVQHVIRMHFLGRRREADSLIHYDQPNGQPKIRRPMYFMRIPVSRKKEASS